MDKNTDRGKGDEKSVNPNEFREYSGGQQEHVNPNEPIQRSVSPSSMSNRIADLATIVQQEQPHLGSGEQQVNIEHVNPNELEEDAAMKYLKPTTFKDPILSRHSSFSRNSSISSIFSPSSTISTPSSFDRRTTPMGLLTDDDPAPDVTRTLNKEADQVSEEGAVGGVCPMDKASKTSRQSQHTIPDNPDEIDMSDMSWRKRKRIRNKYKQYLYEQSSSSSVSTNTPRSIDDTDTDVGELADLESPIEIIEIPKIITVSEYKGGYATDDTTSNSTTNDATISSGVLQVRYEHRDYIPPRVPPPSRITPRKYGFPFDDNKHSTKHHYNTVEPSLGREPSFETSTTDLGAVADEESLPDSGIRSDAVLREASPLQSRENPLGETGIKRAMSLDQQLCGTKSSRYKELIATTRKVSESEQQKDKFLQLDMSEEGAVGGCPMAISCPGNDKRKEPAKLDKDHHWGFSLGSSTTKNSESIPPNPAPSAAPADGAIVSEQTCSYDQLLYVDPSKVPKKQKLEIYTDFAKAYGGNYDSRQNKREFAVGDVDTNVSESLSEDNISDYRQESSKPLIDQIIQAPQEMHHDVSEWSNSLVDDKSGISVKVIDKSTSESFTSTLDSSSNVDIYPASSTITTDQVIPEQELNVRRDSNSILRPTSLDNTENRTPALASSIDSDAESSVSMTDQMASFTKLNTEAASYKLLTSTSSCGTYTIGYTPLESTDNSHDSKTEDNKPEDHLESSTTLIEVPGNASSLEATDHHSISTHPNPATKTISEYNKFLLQEQNDSNQPILEVRLEEEVAGPSRENASENTNAPFGDYLQQARALSTNVFEQLKNNLSKMVLLRQTPTEDVPQQDFSDLNIQSEAADQQTATNSRYNQSPLEDGAGSSGEHTANKSDDKTGSKFLSNCKKLFSLGSSHVSTLKTKALFKGDSKRLKITIQELYQLVQKFNKIFDNIHDEWNPYMRVLLNSSDQTVITDLRNQYEQRLGRLNETMVYLYNLNEIIEADILNIRRRIENYQTNDNVHGFEDELRRLINIQTENSNQFIKLHMLKIDIQKSINALD